MTKTTPGLQNHAWFVLADAMSCRLLCCSMTRRGKHHVDEYDSFENALSEQEHTRPMNNAGETHHVEDNERRFAGQIVAWLRKRTEQYEVDRLVVFAPPRMLGVLRTVSLGSLKGHVEEIKGDLMRLKVGQLADHPVVRELVMPHPSDERPAFEAAASTSVVPLNSGGVSTMLSRIGEASDWEHLAALPYGRGSEKRQSA